jgi:hypothetical protein
MSSRLVLTLAIALLGACSSGTPPGPTTPPGSSTSPIAPTATVSPTQTPEQAPSTTPAATIRYECSLLTRGEIEAITGRVVIDAHVNPSLTEPNCVWYFEPRPDQPTTNPAPPQVELFAWTPNFDAEAFEAFSVGQHPVPGVGDGAYWGSVCRWVVEDAVPNGCRFVFLLGDTIYSVDAGWLWENETSESPDALRAMGIAIAQAAIPQL